MIHTIIRYYLNTIRITMHSDSACFYTRSLRGVLSTAQCQAELALSSKRAVSIFVDQNHETFQVIGKSSTAGRIPLAPPEGEQVNPTPGTLPHYCCTDRDRTPPFPAQQGAPGLAPHSLQVTN